MRISFIIAVLLWSLSGPALGISVVATVDRNVVAVNESFQLTFEADGNPGQPDFSLLRGDFEILNQAQSQNLSIVNGQTSRQFVWDLTLMATRTGDLRIPAISFGAVSSRPITITVQPQGVIQDEDKAIDLDVEVDVEQPYVQQQVVFTVRLSRSVNITSATLSELEVEGVDAIVERFGDDKEFQMVRNGRRWRIVERRYVVFPQQSGHMIIRPLRFQGNVLARRSVSSFDIFNQSAAKHVALKSESVTLNVLEPPASVTGSWLPAKHISLTESWPARQEVKVGNPITREIIVQAEGLTAAQLPELNIRLPENLRAYPEQPRLENKGNADGVIGTRTETAAIIPTQPGTLILPEVSLAWWNIDKRQPELATIPARTLEVAAAPADAGSMPPLPAEVGEEKTGHAKDGDVLGMESAQFESLAWWPWVSLGLGIAWMITVILWIVDRQRNKRQTLPGGGIESSSQPNRNQVLTELKQAVRSHDAAECRDALIKWGQVLWPQNPPTSLGQLANRCGGSLSTELRQLEQVLYAGKADWDSKALLQEIQAFKDLPREQSAAEDVVLEPLYRS